MNCSPPDLARELLVPPDADGRGGSRPATLQEKESISGYLKVADTKITAAERALEAAREEKIAKIHRLAEIDDAIREAREARSFRTPAVGPRTRPDPASARSIPAPAQRLLISSASACAERLLPKLSPHHANKLYASPPFSGGWQARWGHRR